MTAHVISLLVSLFNPVVSRSRSALHAIDAIPQNHLGRERLRSIFEYRLTLGQSTSVSLDQGGI